MWFYPFNSFAKRPLLNEINIVDISMLQTDRTCGHTYLTLHGNNYSSRGRSPSECAERITEVILAWRHMFHIFSLQLNQINLYLTACFQAIRSRNAAFGN